MQCVTLVHGSDGAECGVESVTVIKPHPLLIIHKSFRQEFSGLCCDQMTSLWCASGCTNELSGIWVIPPCSRNAKGREGHCVLWLGNPHACINLISGDINALLGFSVKQMNMFLENCIGIASYL